MVPDTAFANTTVSEIEVMTLVDSPDTQAGVGERSGIPHRAPVRLPSTPAPRPNAVSRPQGNRTAITAVAAPSSKGRSADVLPVYGTLPAEAS